MRIDLTDGCMAVHGASDPGEVVFEVLRVRGDDTVLCEAEGSQEIPGVRVAIEGDYERVEFRLNKDTLPWTTSTPYETMGTTTSAVPPNEMGTTSLSVTWSLIAPGHELGYEMWVIDLAGHFNDDNLTDGPGTRVVIEDYDPRLSVKLEPVPDPEPARRFEREEVV